MSCLAPRRRDCGRGGSVLQPSTGTGAGQGGCTERSQAPGEGAHAWAIRRWSGPGGGIGGYAAKAYGTPGGESAGKAGEDGQVAVQPDPPDPADPRDASAQFCLRNSRSTAPHRRYSARQHGGSLPQRNDRTDAARLDRAATAPEEAVMGDGATDGDRRPGGRWEDFGRIEGRPIAPYCTQPTSKDVADLHILHSCRSARWRTIIRDEEAAGSNPVTPTRLGTVSESSGRSLSREYSSEVQQRCSRQALAELLQRVPGLLGRHDRVDLHRQGEVRMPEDRHRDPRVHARSASSDAQVRRASYTVMRRTPALTVRAVNARLTVLGSRAGPAGRRVRSAGQRLHEPVAGSISRHELILG